MRQQTPRQPAWHRLAAVVAAVVLAGCAALPPSKPVANVAEIAGKWEGSGRSASGNMFYIKNMVIRPDGGWEFDLPGGTPSHHTGTVRVVNGKLRSHSNTTGNDSTWTLHEGDGKRLLKTVNDDGRVSAEMAPGKP